MRVVVATHNAHKVEELGRILSPLLPGIELVKYDGPDADETGDTFAANALIKAREAAQHTGLPALADDSGIAVDALEGAPGIRSARYAGTREDADNNALLLENLKGVEDRAAQFMCAAAFVDGEFEAVELGVWPGCVLTEARGAGGFGYDPLFQPDGETRASAELSAAEKDALSHRRRAFEQLAQVIRSRSL
ncbi:MAG: RdgB/HAM1 family non-canonical purine NTP pyrophosphatase [Agrococcus casei]|uniref:dITP/XTP pyrophosphatase n=1 Tax=Agrococcus casei LMG 22410 TaxID=1255656 RepID=A0A1R4FVU3_9MICO|nr:RdgB/HAM1 family non-canonical purine NTP pyrophosphatase [Agrococcus casei]SJM60015.1 Nucleoside 5-triphosphatase RdgB (dHAPTP, dITP, XTP-specific) [Agrococcus casei LMG 22410]